MLALKLLLLDAVYKTGHTCQRVRATHVRGCVSHMLQGTCHTCQRVRVTHVTGCVSHLSEGVCHTCQRVRVTHVTGCVSLILHAENLTIPKSPECKYMRCSSIRKLHASCNTDTGWRTRKGCLISVCHFPQKSPAKKSPVSCAERDLQLKESYASSPPCN